jgi:hypothetical protein
MKKLHKLLSIGSVTVTSGTSCGTIAFLGPQELSRIQEHFFLSLLIAFTMGVAALMKIASGEKP